MEEANGSQSFDQATPGDKPGAVPKQSTTEAEPTQVAESTRLPSHQVLPLAEEELQEHRDAIMRQQMLGRQLLSELTRRHQDNITKENN